MAESIESLAEIIKDYARKYRKVNERVGDIEVKIFGQSRDERQKKAKVVNHKVAGNGLNTSMNNQ